jgi:hypothetical protein
MAQEQEQETGTTAGKKTSGREADESQAHDTWLPEGHNVNQVQDEPIPASHHDDGRPEPDEDSPAPKAGRGPASKAGPPAGGTR